MNFSDALICLKAGAALRRGVWFYDALTLRLDTLARPVIIRLRNEGGESAPWVATSEDLLAEDWELPWNLASLADPSGRKQASAK